MLEYASRGLLGVLTPQGNTTVEPELALLAPPGLGVLNARMSSAAADMADRLRQYFDELPAHVSQFADAPLTALALATTGPSYLVGPKAEARAVSDAVAQGWPPLVTTAIAVRKALAVLGAQTVSLVSPYPVSLTAASERYWSDCGLRVQATERVAAREGFHPIYTLDTAALAGPVAKARRGEPDAVVILGTGAPSLRLVGPGDDEPPVLSCMACLAWLATRTACGDTADAASLRSLLEGTTWRARLEAVHPVQRGA